MASVAMKSSFGPIQVYWVEPPAPGPAENHDVVASPSTDRAAGNSLPL
jgi:hypothetical protein